MPIYQVRTDGGGPLALSYTVGADQQLRVSSVMVNINTAPTTAGNLTITYNARAGAVYDTVLYSLDLTAGATTDVFWQPDRPLWLLVGDALDLAYTNPDGRTIGAQITMEG